MAALRSVDPAQVLQRLVDGLVSADEGPPGPQPPAGASLTVRAPGLDIAVAAGERQVRGLDGGAPRPFTVGTAVDLASVTKAVATSTAILALLQTGVLGLDDPVGRYLPQFTGTPKERVVLRDLLLHRAGVWEWWPTYCVASDAAGGHDAVARLAVRYRPGSGRHYSDLGFMLLGRVVEEVTSSALDVAVGELVLGPLGMTATAFGGPVGGGPDSPRKDADVAAGARGDAVEREMLRTGTPYPVPFGEGSFAGWREHVLVGEVADGNAFHTFGGVAGHAGLFSVPADVARWGHGLLSSLDGVGPWRPDLVRHMLTQGPDAGQGLGLRRWVTTAGTCVADAWGHPGHTGTTAAIIPAHGATVVLATNRLHVLGTAMTNDALWARVLPAVHAVLHGVS